MILPLGHIEWHSGRILAMRPESSEFKFGHSHCIVTLGPRSLPLIDGEKGVASHLYALILGGAKYTRINVFD